MVKGQLKINQMSFMLLAVMIFFALAGLFLISFYFSSFKENVSELNKEEAISLAERLTGNTEFSCGKDYCLSTDKLMALKGMSYYSDFWGVKGIEVWKIGNRSRECTLENYPDCEVYTIITSNESNLIYQSVFVSLCRKESENENVYDKCELGKLLVAYEEVE